MSRGPLPPAVSADRVRAALVEARPAGLTSKQLVAATELSPAQVRRGLAELRDIAAAMGLQPLIWSVSAGYRFCTDPGELQAYERAVFARRLTEISRLLTGTVAPHAALFPQDEWVQLVHAQLGGVKASLGILAAARR